MESGDQVEVFVAQVGGDFGPGGPASALAVSF
jgi:hypothetical protein